MTEKNAGQFVHLTFPRFRRLLSTKKSAERILAIGAGNFLQPIGLALATLDPDTRCAYLHSLCVATPFRGQGIGAALLRRMETEIVRQGYDKAETEYILNNPSIQAFELLLARNGWETPQRRSLYCRLEGEDVLRLLRKRFSNHTLKTVSIRGI